MVKVGRACRKFLSQAVWWPFHMPRYRVALLSPLRPRMVQLAIEATKNGLRCHYPANIASRCSLNPWPRPQTASNFKFSTVFLRSYLAVVWGTRDRMQARLSTLGVHHLH